MRDSATCTSGTVGDAGQPLDLGRGLVESHGRRRPQVNLELAALRDDVRSRAAVDHARVDGDRRPSAVQRVEGEHLVRRLEDRGATLLGLDAGVRGAAGDRDVIVGDALAGADDVAVRARALEDEHRVMLGRQGANDRGAER